MPRRFGADPYVRDRTLTGIVVEGAEANADEIEPSTIERRAASRAERAKVRRGGFILGDQLGARDDTKLAGSHRCVGRECAARRATTHRAVTIHDRAKAP